eukprot:ANDGO_03695.mRNA.1 hypothetical protein
MNDSYANAKVLKPSFAPRPSSAIPRAPAALPSSSSASVSEDPTAASGAAGFRFSKKMVNPNDLFLSNERIQGKRVLKDGMPEERDRAGMRCLNARDEWRPSRRRVSVDHGGDAELLPAKKHVSDVRVYADHDPLLQHQQSARSGSGSNVFGGCVPKLQDYPRKTGLRSVDMSNFSCMSNEERNIMMARKRRVDVSRPSSASTDRGEFPMRTGLRVNLAMSGASQVPSVIAYDYAGPLKSDNSYQPIATERKLQEQRVASAAAETAQNTRLYQQYKTRSNMSTSALTDPLYDKRP